MSSVRERLSSCQVQLVEEVVHQTAFDALSPGPSRDIPAIQWCCQRTISRRLVEGPETTLPQSK